MYIVGSNGIMDPDLDFLVHVADVLDEQLESISRESVEVPDPDAFGLFDRGEHIIGLGFVACQAYMTATYGFINVPKRKAFQVGPRHVASGRFLVDVINKAANFWKHHNEWSPHGDEPRQQRVRNTFGELGFPVDSNYPLSNILTELTTPEEAQFHMLTGGLAQWRDELEQGRVR